MENLYRQAYEALTEQQRKEVLESLATRRPGLKLQRFESFDRFAMRTETAVYELDGAEFVFVPGDTVTLGWESFADGLDAETQADMDQVMEEYDISDLTSFLASMMSPVRTMTVAPMLVERKLHEIGWHRVAPDSEVMVTRRSDIEEFEASPYKSITKNNQLRLSRSSTGTVVEEYKPIAYAALIQTLQEQGYSLPTEDEWEYLCGGGTRTLWRWGDSIPYDTHLRYFEEAALKGTPYDMELPNQFGLHIAYDPYKYEVVDAPCMLKGADGGSFICGGMGVALGYLPVATYFQSPDDIFDDYKADIGGSYTRYRKVIRL
ncbi:hypothetical protein BRE01_68300 [Brevibacillus reuszeri]|uniref:Uncharacterized protein n=1 Tax=Brevibacillus reuszeri TaxID=54915 RepID=A0A0K9YQM0_9BACL|nr:SUMF1/EgtB/PvdO family nonheme iron enzyme [Brevibacillus reuszeri]KNB70475.1 hypothetical protein ADS79_16250 [Brevibacillus reuszeri]MED1861817.1 SUMF1/EgtB/PvdO family nonheme iron enzyme [Brevibacillus reuszeri]GED73128.1 hypothetical protein BRE01_68300 [Brevibacillus reuszeri]